MVKQIGVEKGVCVEARCAETGYKWITGMAVKVFNNGRVKIATPGKSYTVSCLECRICDDVPDNLKTFFEKKRKELGLPDLSKK